MMFNEIVAEIDVLSEEAANLGMLNEAIVLAILFAQQYPDSSISHCMQQGLKDAKSYVKNKE